jgi:hypothetical protein
MTERRRLRTKRTRATKQTRATRAPPPPPRLALFGPPLLLEGEDRTAYDELVTRLFEAVTPVDVIDEMHLADVVAWEWEVLRWRRFKWNLIRASSLKVLKRYVHADRYTSVSPDILADYLARYLAPAFPKNEPEAALTLAQACVSGELEAIDKVNELLDGFGLSVIDVVNKMEADMAAETAKAYARREPGPVALVHRILDSAGTSMDALTAEATAEDLGAIEPIDRLITIAESRRDASLREIERRRAVLGERLRRSVQRIEDGESRLIDMTPTKGKNAG